MRKHQANVELANRLKAGQTNYAAGSEIMPFSADGAREGELPITHLCQASKDLDAYATGIDGKSILSAANIVASPRAEHPGVSQIYGTGRLGK
jgi:hypothetical protein